MVKHEGRQPRVSRLSSEAPRGRCLLLPGGVVRILVPLLLVAGQAGAQVETSETVRLAPLIVPRAGGEIVMDGRIDERAWQAVDPVPVVMHVPQFGAEPTERTNFRIVHDGQVPLLLVRSFRFEAHRYSGPFTPARRASLYERQLLHLPGHRER